MTEPVPESDRGRHSGRTRRRLTVAVFTLVVVAAVLVTIPRWGDQQLAVPAGSPHPSQSDPSHSNPTINSPGPAGTGQGSWPGCAAAGAFDQPDVAGPPPGARAVPSDFQAVQVRVCTQDVRRADNGDQVQVNLEQEAAATAQLLAYLAQPSVTPEDPDRQICPLNLVDPPWLVLLDRDGRYVAPIIPTDECGFPLRIGDPDGAP